MPDTNEMKFYNILSETDEYYELIPCNIEECTSQFLTEDDYKALCVRDGFAPDVYLGKPRAAYTWGERFEPARSARCLKISYVEDTVQNIIKAWDERKEKAKTKTYRITKECHGTVKVICHVLKNHGLTYNGTAISKIVEKKPRANKVHGKHCIFQCFNWYLKSHGIYIKGIYEAQNINHNSSIIKFMHDNGVTIEQLHEHSDYNVVDAKTQQYVDKLWNDAIAECFDTQKEE